MRGGDRGGWCGSSDLRGRGALAERRTDAIKAADPSLWPTKGRVVGSRRRECAGIPT
jgi:hypothetical protein